MTQYFFQRKVRIDGTLQFDTAFHIGSGKEGDLASDLGVMKDAQDWPVLPGSTLKGNFRATAEKLAHYFGLSACMLDLSIGGIDCVGDQKYFQKKIKIFQKLETEKEKLDWLKEHTCDMCRLFGSPLQASRIFFSDGQLQKWIGGYQVRDGVAIDRDSGTARPKMKYDYEVASRDTAFGVFIDLDNPSSEELVLVSAVISEWKSGFRLGGFTSRGLGHTVLTVNKIEEVNYTDPAQLKDYLLNRKMKSADDLLTNSLAEFLNNKEASHAEKNN